MTVKELIAALRKSPPDSRVVISGDPSFVAFPSSCLCEVRDLPSVQNVQDVGKKCILWPDAEWDFLETRFAERIERAEERGKPHLVKTQVRP